MNISLKRFLAGERYCGQCGEAVWPQRGRCPDCHQLTRLELGRHQPKPAFRVVPPIAGGVKELTPPLVVAPRSR